MKEPVVFGIYGESNTGKTTLMVQLIRQLTDDGYNVATVKKSDKKIGVDTEGKDTWKHCQAGSNLVVFSSSIETDFMVKQKMDTQKIIQQLNELGTFDIILVEGARDKNIAKIRIGNISCRENTILSYDGNIEEILDIMKKKIKQK